MLLGSADARCTEIQDSLDNHCFDPQSKCSQRSVPTVHLVAQSAAASSFLFAVLLEYGEAMPVPF